MSLKKSYLKYCEDKDLEINENQIKIVQKLNEYYNLNFNQSFIKKIFKDKKNKLGFYLVGDVGVGKTMILNFFFERLKEKKSRLHFNEFMIKFHDFIFENKKMGNDNGLEKFVKNLSNKTKILYFDEFQVTNIVDAMILGKLFEKIFNENIKVIFSSNININDLYKNGLQRDQFLPFLKILKNNCTELELKIKEDYRATKNENLSRFLSPINNSSNFKFNKYFRKATKNKKLATKSIEVKGRKLVFENFHEGVLKVSFDEICNRNLGSQDYIEIAKESDFIFIENLPKFNEINSNQQQRFITFIDIIYEKKIPLMIKSEVELNSLESSKSMKIPFKRTVSRLHELTSQSFN
ncbi:cell division protein ZapE [Candidatus Pelagibacter sp.]|jgi:predicted ATPase|nr:cell division protein ZapE [Candidatus Pelagibacter sp.]